MKAIGLLLGLIMISAIGGNPFLNNELGEEAYAARSLEKQGKQNWKNNNFLRAFRFVQLNCT